MTRISRLFYLFSIISISCLGILVYSNTFHCSFHFDDAAAIVNNPLIRNISYLLDHWQSYPCRFIIFLSFVVNYHFNGLNVFGYHLFNLAVHLGSAILVWWLTLLTLSTPALKENKITPHAPLIALLTGLVFVSHPLQTEAVTYIWQRASSLEALFFLASLCFYVKSRLLQVKNPGLRGGRFYYIFSLIIAVVAMFTKENAITLPLVTLLYEFSFFEGKKGLNWWRLGPFMLTVFIIPLTIFFTHARQFQDIQKFVKEPGGTSPMEYLLTQFRVIVAYIRLIFLPFNQNLDHDYPIAKSIFELPVLISFLFLEGILISAKQLFSKYRLVSFSICWFFLTLSLESSLLPLKNIIFEHRLYLPLVGYSIFLVSGMYYLWGKNTIKGMVIVLTIIVIVNSILTYQRNKVWINEYTLWNDAVHGSPHKARPYNNLGVACFRRGDLAQAMVDYNKAIDLDPHYTEAYYNRGLVYEKKGNRTQAMSEYAQALKLDPNFAPAYYSLRAYTANKKYNKQGDIIQTIADYNKVIEKSPHLADLYYKRGTFDIQQGNLSQAILDYTKAVELDPNDVLGYNDRGNTYDLLGQLSLAIADFTKIIEINPQFVQAYFNRGNEYNKQGHWVQALSDFNQAIERNPSYAAAYNNRAIVEDQLKEYDNSWEDVHKAEELGYVVNFKFINKLKEATGRDE